MSVHVMSWVLRCSEEKLGRRLVLLVLADHAKEDGTAAWPSVETIGREARLSERQVRNCLRGLEASKAIAETGTSKTGTHVYTIHMGAKTAEGQNPEGQNRTESPANIAPEPSLEQPSKVSASDDAEGPPALYLPNGHNIGFEAIAEVCGVEKGSPREREVGVALFGNKRRPKAEPGIRWLVWTAVLSGEEREELARHDLRATFETRVAQEIRRRAALYRVRFTDAELTPTALAKWFLDLRTTQRPGSDVPIEEALNLPPEPTDEERAANAERLRGMTSGVGKALDE